MPDIDIDSLGGASHVPQSARVDAATAPTSPRVINIDDLGGVPSDPTWAESGTDFARQLGRGTTSGAMGFFEIPNNLAWFAAKHLGASDKVLDSLDVTKNPYWKPAHELMNAGPEPETTAGRFGHTIGNVIGGSIIPEAAMFKAAPALAAAPRSTSTSMGSAARNVLRDGAEAIVEHPGQMGAMSLASAASAGAAQQGAAELGFGLTGQAIAGMIGGFGPAAVTSTAASKQLANQRAINAVQDAAAFDELGVRKFGPAFNEGPVASVAKQLSETPLVGSPVKAALDNSLEGARDATMKVAQQLGPEVSHGEMGSALQRGLDRYRSAGVNAVDEKALTDIGINPSSNVQTRRSVSAGAADRADEADRIRADAGITPRPINQITLQRRGASDLSDQELNRIIALPSDQTSFAAKAEAMYERAWRQVPDLVKTNGHSDPGLLNMPNTRETFRNIQNQVANQIAGQGRIGGDLAERIMNPRSNFSLEDMKSIKTEIGRALGNFGLGDARLDRTQLKQLYGALSKDIEVGTVDLANRARIYSQLPPSDPRYIAPQVAAQADRALPMMRRADQFFKAGQDRVDNFMSIIGANKMEQASTLLTNAALGKGRGNIQLLRTAKASLRPEEWDQFAGQVLRNLGEPIGSARGTTQEIGFSVSSFLTRWNNMEPSARALLFGGEHAHSIDNLYRIVNRLANVEALANTSRSGTNALNMAGALEIGGALWSGHIGTALASLGSGFAASKLMSSKPYADWMTKYVQLRSNALNSPSMAADGALARHAAKLGLLTRADPELVPVLAQVERDNHLVRQ